MSQNNKCLDRQLLMAAVNHLLKWPILSTTSTRKPCLTFVVVWFLFWWKHKADRHVSVKDIKTGTDLLRVEGAIEFVLSFAEISLKISFYTLWRSIWQQHSGGKNNSLNGSRKASEETHLFFTVLCCEIYFSYVCMDGLDWRDIVQYESLQCIYRDHKSGTMNSLGGLTRGSN